MKAAEEFERLQRLHRSARCLIATAPVQQLEGSVDTELLLEDGMALVGTLDVQVATRSPSEVLIGKQRSAVYMLNVCTADVARRRGVGQQLVDAAAHFARDAGTHICCAGTRAHAWGALLRACVVHNGSCV